MEVESCDNYSDDNNSLPEKKPKRSVKTPSQIDALEMLYGEHKYPTEFLKLQLGESVGLTEKQVSGWFCHRRSKEKKLKEEASELGKQDRSSGVIQERGSGLRQDSCGSTKQGDLRHFDPREVESRMFAVEELLADIENEIGNHSIENQNDTDDTSSGSSSEEDTYFPQSTAPRRLVTSRSLTQKANIVSVDVRDSKGRSGPSGYLKVKLQGENGAITSVKRQLGRHYREDGPPLGINFDPLPPGAFESPIKHPVEEPDFVNEQKLHQLLYASRTCKRPYPGTGFEEYNSKLSSYNYDLDGNLQFTKKSTLSYQRCSVSKKNPSKMINEDYTGEPPLYDDYEMRARQDAGRIKESVSSHFQLQNGRKLTGKQRVPSNHGDGLAKSTQIKYIESSPSNFLAEQNKFLHWDERELPRRTCKEVDILKVQKQCNDYHDPVEVSVLPENLAKRSRQGFLQQQYITKTTTGKITPWANPS